MGISAWEIALIVLVVLLLFGAKRVPQAARSLGQGMREFKESVSGHTKELKEATLEAPKELKRGLDPLDESSQEEARPAEPEGSAAHTSESER